MSNLSRILVPLLLLAVAGGGYWLYSNSTAVAPGPVTPVDPGPAIVDDTPPPPGPGAATGSNPTTRTEDIRKEAVTDNTNADAAQGVKGRILLPNGQPAAGQPLYLMESLMNDPIKVFLMTKSGTTLPPISWGVTGIDGTFALGVRQTGKQYDLRIASDNHPEVNHQSIKVGEDDWYDTGDIKLAAGILIRGRVVDEYNKAGIAAAAVFLERSNQAHTALPTPGRERGIAVVTDNAGGFTIANAPAEGMINLTAEAEGYASFVLRNQQVNPAGAQYTLEIARGQPIAGVVVDGTGEPLGGVTVTAQGLSQKTPQSGQTTTGSDGVFQFPSLREGPYQLVTNSKSHSAGKTPPVMTGDTAVKLVLIEKPWVKLKVLGARGQELKAYSISLKRHFPNNPLGIGNVPEFPDRRITPANYPSSFGGNWAVVRGLPDGEYRFQIEDRDHAKSLSPAFTVRESGDPAEVVATLTMGAAITGTVIDDAGKPVRGALVSTDMNNAFSGDGGIFDLFKSMIPEKHSKAQQKTDGQGRFRLDKLAFAEYMVRIGHPEFCEGSSFDITLSQEGQVADVGVVQLTRGTIIEGFTTLTGQAVGQIKVSLSVPPEDQPKIPAGQENTRPKMPFSASTISDNDGRYRLLKRVPPGRYKVVASRQSGEQNPFMVLLDMRETERIITIHPGQDLLKIDFDLPTR